MTTETLRPNAVGTYTEFPVQYPNSTFHYDKVDDVTPDEGSTYIATSSTDYLFYRDLYGVPDSAIPVGSTINSVTVYIRCVGSGLDTGNTRGYAAQYIRTHDTDYLGAYAYYIGSAWATKYYTWLTNPNTGLAWTIDEINALEIGIKGRAGYDIEGYCYPLYCTQVYVEVDYTPPAVAVACKRLLVGVGL